MWFCTLQSWSAGIVPGTGGTPLQGKRLVDALFKGQSSKQQLHPWSPRDDTVPALACDWVPSPTTRQNNLPSTVRAVDEARQKDSDSFLPPFPPWFSFTATLSVPGGPERKKLSFYDAMSGTRWGPDSADNLTNGQEQLVFLLTVHVLVNTNLQGILSKHTAIPSF